MAGTIEGSRDSCKRQFPDCLIVIDYQTNLRSSCISEAAGQQVPDWGILAPRARQQQHRAALHTDRRPAERAAARLHVTSHYDLSIRAAARRVPTRTRRSPRQSKAKTRTQRLVPGSVDSIVPIEAYESTRAWWARTRVSRNQSDLDARADVAGAQRDPKTRSRTSGSTTTTARSRRPHLQAAPARRPRPRQRVCGASSNAPAATTSPRPRTSSCGAVARRVKLPRSPRGSTCSRRSSPVTARLTYSSLVPPRW
jgi:hypothetical protein